VRHGTSSSTSLGASCPSDCANGPTGSDQWDLVLSGHDTLEECKAHLSETYLHLDRVVEARCVPLP
jgi:hypothetical protein